ncbi:hypothetical protein U1Q18_051089 [Sarracenia purpurea var. burkii]
MEVGSRSGTATKRKPPSNVNRYKEREQAIAKHWRELGKPGTLNNFRRSAAGKQWYGDWARRLQSSSGQTPEPDHDGGEPDSKNSKRSESPIPGTSKNNFEGNDYLSGELERRISELEGSRTPLVFDSLFNDFVMETGSGVPDNDMDISQSSGAEESAMTRGPTGGRGSSVPGSNIVKFPNSSVLSNFAYDHRFE